MFPRILIAVVAVSGLAAALWQAGSPGPALFFQKGVNFTMEGPGSYTSISERKVLDALPKYGVNAVALVPYGFCRRGAPIIRFSGSGIWETDEAMARLASLARQRGMKVMLKPHIWVSRSYPGELDFSSSADRDRWFAQYRAFLEHYAKLATRLRASVFCVGVELSRLSRHETEWRDLIGRARQLYHGPLVYAANFGEEFESIRFWDALDYIGLNNYYPLPDDLSTDAVLRKVEQVQRKYQRPVIFPEAGFPSLEAPHRQPWDETPRRLSPDGQARCYQAVLAAFYRKPWFHGVYWWKVGTNGYGGPQDGSHTPWGKPAMQVIARWYLRGGRS